MWNKFKKGVGAGIGAQSEQSLRQEPSQATPDDPIQRFKTLKQELAAKRTAEEEAQKSRGERLIIVLSKAAEMGKRNLDKMSEVIDQLKLEDDPRFSITTNPNWTETASAIVINFRTKNGYSARITLAFGVTLWGNWSIAIYASDSLNNSHDRSWNDDFDDPMYDRDQLLRYATEYLVAQLSSLPKDEKTTRPPWPSGRVD